MNIFGLIFGQADTVAWERKRAVLWKKYQNAKALNDRARMRVLLGEIKKLDAQYRPQIQATNNALLSVDAVMNDIKNTTANIKRKVFIAGVLVLALMVAKK